MKRWFALILVVILCFSGCALEARSSDNAVTFYYLRTYSGSGTYDSFFSSGVIGSETRTVPTHRQDLNYMLSLYFQGPSDPELESPFPVGCKVLEFQERDGQLTLTLSRMITAKNDMDLTIACACLAKTCMELTGANTIQVESHDQEGKVLFTRIFTKDNLLLADNYTLPAETTEKPQ